MNNQTFTDEVITKMASPNWENVTIGAIEHYIYILKLHNRLEGETAEKRKTRIRKHVRENNWIGVTLAAASLKDSYDQISKTTDVLLQLYKKANELNEQAERVGA